MKLATVILNYFGFEDTFSCVSSVRENLDAQSVLVDNSDDADERKKLEEKFGGDPDVLMIFPAENLGFAAGVNLGLQEALKKGHEQFLLLNNDAVLLHGSGSILSKAILGNPGCLIAPSIKWGDSINRGNHYHKYLGLISDTPYMNGIGSIHYFSGCTLAFDKIFIEKAGFLDEDFFFYGEDVEFSYRAAKKSIPLILIPENLVSHKGSKSAKKASFFYEYHILHAHWLLIFKLIDNPFGKLSAVLGKFSVLLLRSILRSIRFMTMAPMISLVKAPMKLKVRPDIIK